MPGQPFVVGRAGQPDHGGTRPPGQLDGQRADPARRAGDHHGVTFGQRDGPDRGVGRGPGHVQRPGDLPRHARRLGGEVPLLDHDVLGLAGPVVGVADDLVPGREPGHSGSGPGHHPGQVTALPGRERGRPPGVQQALADLSLTRVDPGRLDLDQHLARSRHRCRYVDHREDVDVAVLIEPYCLHSPASALSRPLNFGAAPGMPVRRRGIARAAARRSRRRAVRPPGGSLVPPTTTSPRHPRGRQRRRAAAGWRC